MAHRFMGYLAGAACVLSATGALAQPSSAQLAQSQAQADAAPAMTIERPDTAELRKQVEADREKARAERDRARDQARDQAHAERDAARAERDRVVMRHGDPAEHLRTLLQLKPGQEAALQAYVAALRPQHAQEHVVVMSDHREVQTTPQRLAEMQARLDRDAAQGRARIEATRRFYDQLEPSQKKVFDEMPMLMGPMMGPGPMKVMINMDGHGPIHGVERMPPAPPLPPAPPAPPRLDD